MTDRVLVAVDGTKASNTALEIACALCDTYDANLGLLCVMEPGKVSDDLIKGAVIEGVVKRPSYDDWYHNTIDTAASVGISQEAQRAEYVARLSTAIAENVVTEAEAYSKNSAAKAVKTFVRAGNVADEIIKVAKENNADFIVMGHDMRGRIESLIVGSVAEKVVRDAPCPCLVYCHPKNG